MEDRGGRMGCDKDTILAQPAFKHFMKSVFPSILAFLAIVHALWVENIQPWIPDW